MKEHFAELQTFITFSLTRQTAELRAEFKRDIGRVEQRLDGHDRRFGGLEERIDALERKMDAHHEAVKIILADILDRLPASRA